MRSCARPGSCRAAARRARAHRRPGTSAWWTADRSQWSRPFSSAASVVTVPATPTTVLARRQLDAEAGEGVESAVDRTGRRLYLLRGRWVRRHQPLGHPHRADVQRPGGVDLAVTEHELGGAAADVDDEERPGQVPALQRAGRAVVGKGCLLVAAEHLGVDTEPLVHGRRRNTAALAASRVAEVAQKRTASAPCERSRSAYSSTAAQRSPDRLLGEPSGAVDVLTEPHDAGFAGERHLLAGGRGRGRRSGA